jgi:Homoserine dehydrogenase
VTKHVLVFCFLTATGVCFHRTGIPIIRVLQQAMYGDTVMRARGWVALSIVFLVGDRDFCFGLCSQIAGIINGTTNFMLTAMADGASYGDILRQAQELGYAEGRFLLLLKHSCLSGDDCSFSHVPTADPSADVDGWDAQSKLLLLIKLAFGVTLTSTQVPTTGISQITGCHHFLFPCLACPASIMIVVVSSGTT